MPRYVTIQDLVPEGQRGVARVEHFTLSDAEASFLAAEARDWSIVPGRYARLYVRDALVMSDTLMERESNWEFVSHATGRVLIAGLGLGMVLPPVLEKPDVEHVTVLEVEPDVIDLVEPAYAAAIAAGGLRILQADVHSWQPEPDERFDTIYFDVWPDITTSNLPEIEALHARYAPWLNTANPSAWLGSWQHERLLEDYRLGTQPW